MQILENGNLWGKRSFIFWLWRWFYESNWRRFTVFHLSTSIARASSDEKRPYILSTMSRATSRKVCTCISLIDCHLSMQVTIYSSFKKFRWDISYINVLVMSLPWHLYESIMSLKGKPWVTKISRWRKLIVLLISTCDSNNALVCAAHSWNIFQQSKRNFVSPRGHLISSISLQLQ